MKPRQGSGGKRWGVSIAAQGPMAAAGTLVNLTNTSFSSMAGDGMGNGNWGNEMNLSLIHSLMDAKYSIIKVIHILYGLTCPDIFSLQEWLFKNLGILSAQMQEVVF